MFNGGGSWSMDDESIITTTKGTMTMRELRELNSRERTKAKQDPVADDVSLHMVLCPLCGTCQRGRCALFSDGGSICSARLSERIAVIGRRCPYQYKRGRLCGKSCMMFDSGKCLMIK